MPRPRLPRALAALLVPGALLVGCGGSDEGTSSADCDVFLRHDVVVYSPVVTPVGSTLAAASGRLRVDITSCADVGPDPMGTYFADPPDTTLVRPVDGVDVGLALARPVGGDLELWVRADLDDDEVQDVVDRTAAGH